MSSPAESARRLGKFFHYLRFRPFDEASAEGRANERYRLAAWAIAANVLSTGLGLLAFAITVPLTLSYLGDERFGVWMTIASLAGMLSFLDLGVGNALINRTAAAKATGDPRQLQCTITHGLLLLCALGLASAASLSLAIHWLPMDRLVKVTGSLAAEEAKDALRVFVLLFSTSIPLNGVQKAFQGLQRAWQAHLARALGSMLSILLVVALAKQQAGPSTLLLATYGVQVVMPLALLVPLFRERMIGKYAPIGVRGLVLESRGFLRLGGLFLVLQVGVMIGWGADALIASSVLGAAEVTKLVIVQRLFQFVTVPLAIANAPLWGAYAEAHARGDHAFVVRTLKRSLFGTLVAATLASALLFLASPWILKAWIGEVIAISAVLVAAYALWAVIDAAGNAFAMCLNGIGEVRVQVLSTLLFCSIALPLKLAFAAEFGIEAIVLSTVVAYLIAPAGLYLLLFWRGTLRIQPK